MAVVTKAVLSEDYFEKTSVEKDDAVFIITTVWLKRGSEVKSKVMRLNINEAKSLSDFLDQFFG